MDKIKVSLLKTLFPPKKTKNDHTVYPTERYKSPPKNLIIPKNGKKPLKAKFYWVYLGDFNVIIFKCLMLKNDSSF